MKVQLQPDPICGICQEPTVSVFGKVGQKKKSPECILSFKTKNNIIGGCQIQVS